MQAKVIFYMKDRSEYEFDVESTSQRGLYEQAEFMLNKELKRMAGVTDTDSLLRGWDKVERWRSFPKESGTPGMDKTDGLAARSPLQKVRFDLLPVAPLVEVAQVFTFGAFHYGDRNWEEGFSWSRCIGSTWRHFLKWSVGEDIDDESGLSHLAHVVANILFLMEYAKRGKGTDDRQKYTPEVAQELFAPLDINSTQEKQ